MDFVTLGVFVVCFVVVLLLVGFISVVGTREQTYEDGLQASRLNLVAGTKEKRKAKPLKAKKDEPAKASTASKAVKVSCNYGSYFCYFGVVYRLSNLDFPLNNGLGN